MKLVALHGMSMNGAVMRARLGFLRRALPSLEVVAPDAPHECPVEMVDRLYAVWDAPRQAPPHRMWWNASDDGREYRGWEATCDLLKSVLTDGPVGLMGFSQGAILATAIAAMAAQGQMPAIEFAILIAGRTPRADVVQPFLTRPIALPSLHVWGENDKLVGESPRELVDLFAPAQREIVTWPGQLSVPKSGPASDAIVAFLTRQLQ
jgi:pimeloyl-ACP methyl ester carboxylesterase